jgi:hypothetical protein
VLRDGLSIDEGELHTLVCEHIVDSVFDLMRWNDGEFEFVIDEANIDDVGVTREVDEVVTEVRRRLDVWAGIDSKVSSADTVLSVTLVPDGDPTLSRDEWALLALIDGRRSVGDLVMMCGRGQYAVAVALAELVSRGLLRTNDTDGVGALIRRQELLSSLESGAPARPARPAEPAAEAVAVAPIDPFPASAAAAVPAAAPAPASHEAASAPAMTGPTLVSDRGMHAESSEPTGDLAEVSSISRGAAMASDGAPVTPHRPEPFLPAREPDHPEPLAVAAGGGVVASAAPATSAAIERDPSVNKSLLLRLIAGVRGL